MNMKTSQSSNDLNKQVFKNEIYKIERVKDKVDYLPQDTSTYANNIAKNRLAVKFNPDSL